jgi:allophanate hydrolase
MPPTSVSPSLDLQTLTQLYDDRRASPEDMVGLVLERIAAYSDPAVWTHVVPRDELLVQARGIAKRREAGERLPLFGAPFTIKDNIDLAGHPTTAGCPAFSYVPQRSAAVVERLQAAGAIAIGKTNLDQFATGLMGDRSPYGVCKNVFNPAYISGGSSSGSAVAVSAGLVSFGVATDTAGSGRVPAAFNNIVGLKPTPGLLSNLGVVPACASLDCISFLSLTVEDSARLLAVACGEDGWRVPAERGALATFATPREEDLDFLGDVDSAALFRNSVKRLEQGGAHRTSVDLTPFQEVAALLYDGPWVVERLASLESFLSTHASEFNPVVRAIVEGATRYKAVDVFRGIYRLKALRDLCLKVFDDAEVLMVPSAPTLPTMAQVQADSLGWSRNLGKYTNFVNLLGLSALALPGGFTTAGLPTGITLIGPAGDERRLCEIGMAWERQLDLPLGATGANLRFAGRSNTGPVPPGEDRIRVAVGGAHLSGQPLHAALCGWGARFVRASRTAPKYRFLALMELDPPRAGLLHTPELGRAVALELYDLPVAGFGRLVASVAPPLAIGTVELEDGERVKGFLIESSAASAARDITEFGGWRGYRRHLEQSKAQEP